MNDSNNPQVAAEQARATSRQACCTIREIGSATEAMRAVAEKNVAHDGVHECSKDALEAALETLQRSFDALGQGTTALQR